MPPRRILLAALFHETHCFVPDITDARQFDIRSGAMLLARSGDGSPTDGFLEVAARHGWEVVPTVSYAATPSGMVADAVLEAFMTEVEHGARAALLGGLDGIFVVLHGAMVTQGTPDPEGILLERLRSLPGAARLPLFGVIDLHANLTARMGRFADALVAYRENPHTDARAASMRAAELLHRALSTHQRPRTFTRNAPIVWPPTGVATADTPMSELEALARHLEKENPEFWVVNVIAGFAFADVAEAGVAFSVATTGRAEAAERALCQLVELAVSLRETGLSVEPSADDVLRSIWPVADGPTFAVGPMLLVEPSDNIGGGAPGDGTGVLRAFLRHGVTDAAVIINDPASVQALAETPVGGAAILAVGGKASPLDEGPVTLEIILVSRSDGRFTLEDRESHLASMAGVHIDMGPCAVVRASGVLILLTSNKTPPFDLGQLRSQGIEPTRLKLIGVKAAVAHRAAYDPIARGSHTVLTPGPCTSDVRALPYRRLRRPVFPLDIIPC